MPYRRLFIMRKDLNMSAGKLAAQVAHCAEGFWTLGLIAHAKPLDDNSGYKVDAIIDKDIFEQYLVSSITKTICAAKNKNHLLKAKIAAEALGMEEGVDFDFIHDLCLTELSPEEPDGTTITGIWFKPLPDETAHEISRKFQLYN